MVAERGKKSDQASIKCQPETMFCDQGDALQISSDPAGYPGKIKNAFLNYNR